jgi:hypothetical protein
MACLLGGFFMTDEKIGVSVLYKSIGELVVRWAMLEQSLDMCVAVVFRQCGGRSLSKEIPRSLSVKCAFLKRAFKKLPPLVPKQYEALDILRRVDLLKGYRHDLIHAAISGTEFVGGKFAFTKLDYEADIHVVREVSFDLKTFPTQSESVLRLAIDVGNLSEWLVETHVRPKQAQSPHRAAGQPAPLGG